MLMNRASNQTISRQKSPGQSCYSIRRWIIHHAKNARGFRQSPWQQYYDAICNNHNYFISSSSSFSVRNGIETQSISFSCLNVSTLGKVNANYSICVHVHKRWWFRCFALHCIALYDRLQSGCSFSMSFREEEEEDKKMKRKDLKKVQFHSWGKQNSKNTHLT